VWQHWVLMATLGIKITGTAIISVLISKCLEVIKELDAQGVSNVLWAMATIGILSKKLINQLYEVCCRSSGFINEKEYFIFTSIKSTRGREASRDFEMMQLRSTTAV
jgi:hypothetical protein